MEAWRQEEQMMIEKEMKVCLRLQPAHRDVGGVLCTEERGQSGGEMEENGKGALISESPENLFAPITS